MDSETNVVLYMRPAAYALPVQSENNRPMYEVWTKGYDFSSRERVNEVFEWAKELPSFNLRRGIEASANDGGWTDTWFCLDEDTHRAMMALRWNVRVFE